MSAKKNLKIAVRDLFGVGREEYSEDDSKLLYTEHISDETTETPVEEENTENEKSVSTEKVREEPFTKTIRNFIPRSNKEGNMATNYESEKTQLKTTIISSETTITGSMLSDGNVEILGNMTGDIDAKGNIKVYGKVIGDIKGSSIELISSRIQGNISAASSLIMNSDAVVIGNVVALDMVVDGKIKGDIKVEKSIVCQDKAVILGKVYAQTISIKEGAKLSGEIMIANSKDNAASFQ